MQHCNQWRVLLLNDTRKSVALCHIYGNNNNNNNNKVVADPSISQSVEEL